MANLPPITQLAGNNRALFEGYWNLADAKRSGRVDGGTAAQFLKKSQLRETTLHKIWNLSDPNATGFLDKQGFFLALRLVGLCQGGKEPAIANLSLSDPLPKLAGIELPPIGTAYLWTIDAQEKAKYDVAFQSQQLVNGLLTGDKAKPLMLASKLPVNTLGKIWSLADIDCDGSLDKDEFAVAMKLITVAQSGETLPPTLPSSLIPPSKIKPPVSSAATATATMSSAGVQPSLATTSLSTTMAGGSSGSGANSPMLSPSPVPQSSPLPAKKQPPLATTTSVSTMTFPEWIITSEIKSKYDTYFQGIDKDHDGYVTGEEAKGLLSASNLPLSQLAHIWNLCDISKTGRLNAEQFALAMFLVAEKVRGKPLPNELTRAMIPPSLRQAYAASLATATSTTPTSGAASSSTSISGLATVSQGAGSMVALETSTTTTSSAWGAPIISSSNGDSAGFGFGSDFSSIKELDTISNEIDTIRKEKAQLSEDIKTKQDLIQQRKGEIKNLQTDVETAAKQRETLEREKVEAQTTLDQLDGEKAKYEGQIAELKQKCQDEQEEIERLKLQLSEQESSKQAQSEELESLKEQLETLRKEEREYKAKVDAARAELDRLQKTNLALQSDMSQVRQKVESLKEEHSNLTNQLSLFPVGGTSSSTSSSSVINIHDVGQLSSELHVPHLSEPDAISARATAGSSSPVSSISGFSTNSHLDDGADDNTQSSSSLAVAASTSGGAKDDKKIDPFASTSSGGGSDLFSAFSVPTSGSSDPFFSGGGASLFSGKPSDVSAFDPFGISDPFKSSGSASGSTGGGGAGDFFSSDPFASTSTAPVGGATSPLPPSSGAPPTTAGTSSADPFSGQDPFSSDPFGSSSSKATTVEQTSAWGGSSPFAMDPFGNQQNVQTPTDPFGSSDPFGFGDDPFASKSDSTPRKGGDQINPFQSNSSTSNNNTTPTITQKREEVVVPEALPKPGPRAKEWERVAWAKRESEREDALRRKRQQEELEDLEKAIRDSMKS